MHLSLSTALRSASRCSRPLSTPYGRNALFALGARLSCSHVLFGGLRPSPSFQLPTVLGCLAPLALVSASATATLAMAAQAASAALATMARVSAASAAHAALAAYATAALQLFRTRRMRRRRWRPKPILLYQQRDDR